MNIFYITTEDPTLQGDYLECSTLIGLRTLLGGHVIDLPRKKVMYGDFSDTPKDSLHGRGFTYFSRPIADVDRRINPTKDDVLIYGVVPGTYGVERRYDLEEKVGLVCVMDGHDDPNIRNISKENVLYFKRELFASPQENIYFTGFGIPSWMIRPIDLNIKTQMYQKSMPRRCFEDNYQEIGRNHYTFDNEKDYYDDMSRSWFGLSCKKGGWDSLRTYEIMAAGAFLIFKNIDHKPEFCSPQNFDELSVSPSYENQSDLEEMLKDFISDGKPFNSYKFGLNVQRKLLWENFTCEARAMRLYQDIILKLMEDE